MDQPFALGDVVINSELSRRPSRAPDYQAEAHALNVLAETLAHSPHNVLQRLVEIAQQLCRADSAGISLLEEHDGQQVFRWDALAGILKGHVNGTMPRHASPCGTTIDRDATQLMYLPERFFPALKVEPPVVEALLVPFHIEGQPVGTVWVVAHTDQRRFDREDERIVKTLANFAAAGWQLCKAQGTAEPIASSLNRVNSRSIEIEDKSQARVLHLHRIENIGMPAVGIAHDFNNLLNIIQSYVTIMEFDLGDPTALKEHLNVLKQSVEEGAALTRQLLTVARKNSVDFELTSINSLVRTMAKWLESTLPKTIRIELELDPTVPHIQADAGRLNQLLLNLCVNARDAIGDAGSLRLSTTIMAGNELRERFSETEGRNYVCIAVADTGTGMDENVRQHIFEPFFTTKEESKGTGLGLSIVHGIVTSHHGFIDVDTQPGNGTTFQIYLPVAR